MSLPGVSAAAQTADQRTAADPFGLWQDVPPAAPESVLAGGGEAAHVSFDLSALDDLPAPQPDDLHWQLVIPGPAITGPEKSGLPPRSAPAPGQDWLDLRARQVAAIEHGLEQSEPRLVALLERREREWQTGQVAFDTGSQPQAEADLDALLLVIDPPPAAAVHFGVAETARQLASVNWTGLQQNLNDLLGSVSRQISHMAWVETRLDQQLMARTAVAWSGDFTTWLRPGLPPALADAHRQSLALAVESRAANLHTLLTVAQLAGRLALAIHTPLGAAQALALSWRFVQEVILPHLKNTGKPQ